MLTKPHTISSLQWFWLQIAAIPSVKPGDWLRLIADSDNNGGVVDTHNPTALISRLTAAQSEKTAINLQRLTSAVDWLNANQNHRLVCFEDDNYPPLLREMTHPPLVLFTQGNTDCLSAHQVAIVGSRRASHYGRDCALMLADGLSAAGVVVTSGLATGIDGAAHKGALATGLTIAVMGTGPDRIYPSRHKTLAEEIVSRGGLLITEFFPGVGPRPYHFPQRNRIIAGMSLGTVVVEAGFKSGTLITANLAADLGREVFAVPGNIYQVQAQGCHALIRQGATLVTSVEDILAEIRQGELLPEEKPLTGEKSKANCLATDKILASVDFSVTSTDTVAQRNALPVSDVMAALLEYELRGLVAAVPGGYVRLRGK